MKNKIIIIGGIGSKKCYLNISKKEAIERYKESEKEFDDEYLNKKINELEELEFDDEFVVYNIWVQDISKPQTINQSVLMAISKDKLTKRICEGRCYLYNTEYCNPDDLALHDATTCKKFHTEESFKAINKSR